MRKFETLHPIVLFIFFILIIFLVMFYMDIKMVGVTYLTGLIYYSVLKGKFEIKTIITTLVVTLAMTVANMIVSHNGSMVLFYFNDRAVTLDAGIYGAKSGLMLSTAFMWFGAMSVVMGSESFAIVFAVLPKLAILFSTILRMIPRFIRKYKRVKLYSKPENELKTVNAVFGYALENSMETAQSMEMRGFDKAYKTLHVRFKKRDFICLIYMTASIIFFVFFKKFRFLSMGLLSAAPLFYRAKEAVRLWNYNSKN